jgi:hypothetical protein
LAAGFAIWDYCRESVRFTFGDALGDRVADAILGALRANRSGLTRSALMNFFKRNESAGRIEIALKTLEGLRLARFETTPGPNGGRPTEVWRATDPWEKK